MCAGLGVPLAERSGATRELGLDHPEFDADLLLEAFDEYLTFGGTSVTRAQFEANMAQVVGEAFTSASKERWCTDFKILLQRRDVDLPRDRELVAQLHSIKRRVMPSGNVTFEAERTNRGHADRFWAIVLACQKERGPARGAEAEVGVRVIG